MTFIDDTSLQPTPKLEIVRRVGQRAISIAMHDVDGTHSLIRDWPPVMSLTIHYAMTSGLPEDFDSPTNAAMLVEQTGRKPLPETDRFCVESAGLSALTQMEFGIRRAIELGNIPPTSGIKLGDKERMVNSQIIQRIWKGEECFDAIPEPDTLRQFLKAMTPRLFKLYETVLNGACRDRNTADAWKHPDHWRVPGALEFMKYLHRLGVVNYFVTGAVIYPEGGMYEEVRAVGFEVGPGKLVEAIGGSSWHRKMPKEQVMRELLAKLDVPAASALVIGDGRSEVKAGADMGCVVMSRLPREARRPRELHRELGTNYIVEDYLDTALKTLIRP